MSYHARLSPSSAHRWLECAASVKACEASPKGKSSFFANEGTRAHEIAEQVLTGKTCAAVESDAGNGYDVAEMAHHGEEYANYVRSHSGVVLAECKVDYSPWVPDGTGTADAIVVGKNLLLVADFKYGKGIRVEAEDNSQLKLYALGVLNTFGPYIDCERIKLAIIQPRLDHISEVVMWKTDLLDWADNVVKPAASKAWKSKLAPEDFNPGDRQCRWCAAKTTCRALANKALGTALEGFKPVAPVVVEDLEPKPLGRITNDEIGTLLGGLGLIESWVSAIRGKAVGELLAGREIPGYKLVEGNSNRVWGDETEAAAHLTDVGKTDADLYTRKFVSPAQAEKLFKGAGSGEAKKGLAPFITKPPGKATLAPESDKRPALEVDPTQGFEAVDKTKTKT